MSVQIIHNGYEEIYDVCQIHLFKLNDRRCYSSVFSLNGSESAKLDEYQKFINGFSEPSGKLKIFFDMEYRKVSFMSQYFLKYKRGFDLCTLSEFEEIIRSDSDFKKQVIEFYLDRNFETDREVQHALMIAYPELADMYKVMLHDFVNFYEEYIDLLLVSLKRIRKELELEYQRSNLLLKRLQSKLDLSLLTDNDTDINKWMKNQKVIFISFSICSPYLVMYGGKKDESGWIVLGVDYVTLIEQEWKSRLSVVEICKALGDNMRMAVVENILEFGELSASALAKKYGLSVKAMFYHLELLKNAKVLSSRTRGRNTLYSINTPICKDFLEKIKFLGGKNDEY